MNTFLARVYSKTDVQRRLCTSSFVFPPPSPVTSRPDGKVLIRFLLPAGEDEPTIRDVYTFSGVSLKDVAESSGIVVDGACGGTCKCSTCHMYLINTKSVMTPMTEYNAQNEEFAQRLLLLLNNPPIIDVTPPSDEELDMLDRMPPQVIDSPFSSSSETASSTEKKISSFLNGARNSDSCDTKTNSMPHSSRLGCQVFVEDDVNGLIVRVAPSQFDARISR